MEKKLRHSHQRERILEYLCHTGEHPSAEQIYQDLRPEIPGLSLGTVYRNLKLLEELGKIRRVPVSQGVERYDAICCDHIHFLCSRCGKLQDVPSIDLDSLCGSLPLAKGSRIEKLDLTITGLCPDCAG